MKSIHDGISHRKAQPLQAELKERKEISKRKEMTIRMLRSQESVQSRSKKERIMSTITYSYA